MPSPDKRFKAGDSLEDYCRACKTDRMHTVIAADGEGRPIRVACGFCGSDHNYRGGPRVESPLRVNARPEGRAYVPRTDEGRTSEKTPRAKPARDPFPLVGDRERTAPTMTVD